MSSTMSGCSHYEVIYPFTIYSFTIYHLSGANVLLIKNKEQRTKNKEPRTKNQEPRTKNKDSIN